jgi:hypothetical protein
MWLQRSAHRPVYPAPYNGKTRTTAQHDTDMPVLAYPNMASAHMCLSMQATVMAPQSALFSPTIRNRANSIKFAHQSLCSPQISTHLKAIRHGFLKGCPNLTTAGVTRYLKSKPGICQGAHEAPPPRNPWRALATDQRHNHHAGANTVIGSTCVTLISRCTAIP